MTLCVAAVLLACAVFFLLPHKDSLPVNTATPSVTTVPEILATQTPTAVVTPLVTNEPKDDLVTAKVLEKETNGPPNDAAFMTIHLGNITGPYESKGMGMWVHLDSPHGQVVGSANKTMWDQMSVGDRVILEASAFGPPIIVGIVK